MSRKMVLCVMISIVLLANLTKFETYASTVDDVKEDKTRRTAATTTFSMSKQERSALPECNFTVWHPSIKYFQNRLDYSNFIRFKIIWNESIINSLVEPHAVKPERWVWTYSNSKLSFPYVKWNIDYGVLSFGLLDKMTTDVGYVMLESTVSCRMTLGSHNTSRRIVSALASIINVSSKESVKYENNFFCYLAEVEGMRYTLDYWAGQYLNYPTSFVNYNCCTANFSYILNDYEILCYGKSEKWEFFLLGSYILGILLFLFIFPIFSLKIAAGVTRNEPVISDEQYEFFPELGSVSIETDNSPEWMFLKCKSPMSFFGVFKFCCFRIDRCPVLSARILRFIGVLLAPCVIYIKLFMYDQGLGVGSKKVNLDDLIDHGTPMGLVSLLSRNGTKTFVPAFGGPYAVMAIYYVLGLLFFVLPRSIREIVENGMPTSRPCSSLFFGVGEIIFLSGLNINPGNGYQKGEAVCKCSFYMLFTKQFWFKLFDIQKRRFEYLASLPSTGVSKLLKPVLCLLLICTFFVESFASLTFYGIPFFSFVTMFVKGASKSLMNLRQHYGLLNRIFQNPVCIIIASVCILVLYIFFAYACCLIFIESFSFICQICMFCFLAVLVYPSESFGILFFFVAIIYYLVHLIRRFGDEYLELLTLAVEISVEQESVVNLAIIRENELIISNVVAEKINRVRINDVIISLKDQRHCLLSKPTGQIKIKRNGKFIGIPRELFEYLVRKYRPIHVQFLKVFLKLGLIVTFIFLTMRIASRVVSGASSDMSEVMHVIFVVLVGALPRVMEVALMSQNELVKKDILRRGLELSIEKFWVYKANDA